MNKLFFSIFAILMANCACQKEAIQEQASCTDTTQVVCWNKKTYGATYCPSPDNPDVKIITALNVHTSLDTMTVCDTTQWKIVTTADNNWYMNFGSQESIEFKHQYPPVCGCY